MSEAVVPPLPTEVPKPKRKYTRRKKVRQMRAPKIAGTVPKVEPAATMPVLAPPRPRYGAPKALEEVDRQLAHAIAQKPAYHEQLANLFAETSRTQSRLDRLNQQIQELIAVQRQLDGGVPEQSNARNPVQAAPELDPRVANMVPPWEKDLPPGVGSIPAKQPKVTSPNAGDQVRGEDGFR